MFVSMYENVFHTNVILHLDDQQNGSSKSPSSPTFFYLSSAAAVSLVYFCAAKCFSASSAECGKYSRPCAAPVCPPPPLEAHGTHNTRIYAHNMSASALPFSMGCITLGSPSSPWHTENKSVSLCLKFLLGHLKKQFLLCSATFSFSNFP